MGVFLPPLTSNSVSGDEAGNRRKEQRGVGLHNDCQVCMFVLELNGAQRPVER